MIVVKTIVVAGLWLMLNAWAQAYLYPVDGPRQLEWYLLVVANITILCVWIWRRWKLPNIPQS
jgi:hypothetical protein